MGKYRVKDPIAFIEDGRVVHYWRPADLVDIDDKTAESLGDAVEARGTRPKKHAPAPVKDASAPVKDVAVRGDQGE